MKLLAIDTSTDYLTLAVTDGDKVIGRLHKKAERSHSSLLVPMIDRLLKRAKIRLKDIDAFAIGIGPGSFTGLRIGVATVKGLAYSLKKPVVAVPTLDAIAGNVKGFNGIICPVLDAKKNKVYACLYKSDGVNIKKVSKYLLLSLGDLRERLRNLKEKILLLGDLAGFVKEGVDWYPKADVLARLGLENLKKKRFVSVENLEPLYLYSRECDIKGI